MNRFKFFIATFFYIISFMQHETYIKVVEQQIIKTTVYFQTEQIVIYEFADIIFVSAFEILIKFG
jgi:hypothetical protein